MPHPKYRPKGCGSHPEVGIFPQKLQRMFLWLDWIFINIRFSKNDDVFCLEFGRLSCTLRGNDLSRDFKTGSGCDFFQQFVRNSRRVSYYLVVMDSGTIIYSNKRYIFVASLGPYPAHKSYFFTY